MAGSLVAIGALDHHTHIEYGSRELVKFLNIIPKAGSNFYLRHDTAVTKFHEFA